MSPTVSRMPQRDAPVPYGRTARRLEWVVLPPVLRTLIQRRLGSRVVAAESDGTGFTPGFASVLTCEDGSRHVVKAASKKAQRPFADAHREEVANLRDLPDDLPVPRLLWSHEDDLWVALELEYVDGTAPARPWQRQDLEAALDTLQLVADRLTPPPLPLATFAEAFADCLPAWDHVRRVAPDLPHLEEASALAARFGEATAGDTLVHTDARDDNFVMAGERTLLGDWSRPVVGAAWIDTAWLLVGAHGDGFDADAMLRRRRLTREVPAEDVDAVLALLAGYLMQQRDQPVPGSSPYLRAHQSWYAEACWSWLAGRRGWA